MGHCGAHLGPTGNVSSNQGPGPYQTAMSGQRGQREALVSESGVCHAGALELFGGLSLLDGPRQHEQAEPHTDGGNFGGNTKNGVSISLFLTILYGKNSVASLPPSLNPNSSYIVPLVIENGGFVLLSRPLGSGPVH